MSKRSGPSKNLKILARNNVGRSCLCPLHVTCLKRPYSLGTRGVHTLKGLVEQKSLLLAASSVACLLVLSFPTLPQSETQNRSPAERAKEKIALVDANSVEAQRRAFAVSMVISLATEGRSYTDLALRPRVLARAADALWEVDNINARALFVRAWEAAEVGDTEGVTINAKNGSGGAPPAQVIGLRKLSGNDLRADVLSLASRRDRALGEEFLAKLKSENAQDTGERKNGGNAYSAPEASLKRLLVANKLLAAGDVTAAKDFAAPALTEVNSRSIGFLSDLRAKEPAVADKIFAQLMARVDADPMADANTISGLSSYAFTPGFYIVFWADGHSTWTQPEGPRVPPSLDSSLRVRFFQVAANVLLRPVPPLDQDISSCGRRGRLMVITRLLPLFDQYAPETATALRAQLTAREGRNIDPNYELLTAGIRPEFISGEIAQIEERLGHAKSTSERDQIYAAAAARLSVTGNRRAREFADSINDEKFRDQVRNYVDVELIRFAIRVKNAADVAQLSGAGELTHIQRSWSYTQVARLLIDSDRQQALEFLQKAIDEAERMDPSNPDTSFALINVANQLLLADRTQAWEVLNKTVKFANSAEDFTGDDIRMPTRSMLVTKNGTRFIHLPDADFNFSHLLGALAKDDLFRAIELAKSFKYDAPRAYATLAIARAVLEKPAASTTAKH
jgi:hypothetical protein